MEKTSGKLLSLLLITALVYNFSACGNLNNSEQPSSPHSDFAQSTDNKALEPITLNVWHQWSNDTNELKKLYDQAVEVYVEQNPNIKIHTETLDTEAYKTKIAAEFAGTAKDIDVFYYWGAGMAKKLVNANKLLPLDKYLTSEVKAEILPNSTAAFEFNGQIYSVPSFSWYMTLFCNKTMFEQAGAALPTTYDELLEASKKLSTLEGVTPIASGARDGWNAAFIYQALVLREVGGEKVNAMLSGEAQFDDPGYKEAAEKVVELYKIGAFGANPLETGNDDANAAFITGKAAMRITGSWFANQVYTDATATIDPGSVVAMKIPLITGQGSITDYAGGFVESFWVNKNTKYADEAAKFSIYINKAMGKAAYETGTGFCGWDVTADESQLNPLFIQIKILLASSTLGVLAWDTSMDSYPATIHNEQVQTLFAPGADVNKFITENLAVINH